MKSFAIACAFAMAFAGGAACADTMENAVGNTITVTAGAETHVYHFAADHTYTLTSGGTQVSGAWETADGQVCLTPQGGERTCTAYDASRNVGDTWSETGADGTTTTFAITAGH